MITKETAKDIILKYCEHILANGSTEKFAIQSCELSPCKNYWVIRCNTEDYVLHNIWYRGNVGINAYLVHIQSGEIETIGSAQSVDDYLQDKLDLANAGNRKYVLVPLFNRLDKKTLVHFKQWLRCGISDAIKMLSNNRKKWLTGKKRELQFTQKLLSEINIQTDIVLVEDSENALQINGNISFLEDIKTALNAYLNKINT